MKFRFSRVIVLFFAASMVSAAESAVSITPQGRLSLGKSIRVEWRHNPAWKPIVFPKGKVVRDGARTSIAGECSYPEGRGAKAVCTLTEQDADNWLYTAVLRGIGDTRHISAEIKIPADRPADLEVNGTLFRLSGKKERPTILKWTPVKKNSSFRIVSGMEVYTLRGTFSVSIGDLRFSTKEPYYCIHLHVPESNREKRFDMTISIRREKASMRPVSIASAANMGFTDKQVDDGKGGWTDQGPSNDLSSMTKFGAGEFAGIPFEILDPAKNGGRSCVVLSRFRRFPPIGKLTFAKTESARYLYLLHAAAWVPKNGETIGKVELAFSDGSKTAIPVIAGKDCGNWWSPVFSFENGVIGWTGDNRSSKVGLFVSAFRIPEKGLKSIRFLPGKSVWMIAGVSLGNLRPQRTAERHVMIREDQKWKPIPLPFRFRKGSVMDFSGLNRFHSLRDGALKINDKGHFVLKKDPAKRIRFNGTNFGQFLNVPTHEETDLLVERIAMEGFNSVRLHQFENWLYDRSKPSTLDFKKDRLDNFHYLWAKLREKGMYLTTDLHCTRIVRPGDHIAECRSSSDQSIRKTLTMFSESALQNWKDYARKLLTMKNPYTGMSMLEDPALFAINLDNEAPIYNTWNAHEQLLPLVEKVYCEYLREKKIYTPELARKRGPEFYEFLKERQFKVQREQMRFLREELGAKMFLTNLNNDAKLNLQPFRWELDLIDGHVYHDHPGYPLNNWNVPISNTQSSAIAGGNGSIMNNMRIRLPGKPMIITELQFCYPNRFRSEIAAMAGAYAALQDWDGLYRFAYGHNAKNITRLAGAGSFDHYYDPIGILTGRIFYFLFVRGDVAPASGPVFCYGWENPGFHDRFDPAFCELGFFTGIGSAPANAVLRNSRILPGKQWKEQLPPRYRKALDRYRKEGVAVSSTGEITLDRNAMKVSVVTPKSELFTFPGGRMTGKFLSIRNSLDFSTLSVHSLDDKPLAESRDLLLFHLTDAINSGTVFQNEEARLTLNNGTLPILACRGRADLTMNVSSTVPSWTVQAIGLDGSVLGTIPSEKRDGGLRFRAEVFGPAGVTMIYRITADP